MNPSREPGDEPAARDRLHPGCRPRTTRVMPAHQARVNTGLANRVATPFVPTFVPTVVVFEQCVRSMLTLRPWNGSSTQPGWTAQSVEPTAMRQTQRPGRGRADPTSASCALCTSQPLRLSRTSPTEDEDRPASARGRVRACSSSRKPVGASREQSAASARPKRSRCVPSSRFSSFFHQREETQPGVCTNHARARAKGFSSGRTSAAGGA